MYKITGSDGKEYGPVSADQLRQWIAEGRVNAQTRAQMEDTGEWKPLVEFPEFAPAFSTVSSTVSAPPISAPANSHQLSSFSVAALILLHFATCGIFSMIWLNLMHGKLPKVRSDDPSAGKAVGFCFIPFFNLYWIFFTFRRLCLRIDEQRELYGLPPSGLKGMATTACIFHVIPWLNVLIGLTIISPIFIGMMQSSVNQLVTTSATTASHGTLPAATTASKIPGWAIALIVCACMIPVLAILAGMLLPALGSAREKAHRCACMSNEKQIALAIAQYADDNNGVVPPTLNALSNYVAGSTKMFFCPQTQDQKHYSYQLTGATNLWNSDPDVVVLYENLDNHRAGGNVLYNDGHVAWVNKEKLQQIQRAVEKK